MPINLKKTDILNDIDRPEEGYIILGFDENGELVTKDSDGTYKTVLPSVDSETIDNLIATYITLGNRTDDNYGLYSIAAGVNVDANGGNTIANGSNVIVDGENSSAQGSYLSVTSNNSFAGGSGFSLSDKITVNGLNSFAYFSVTSSGYDAGIFSNNSAILGGINHRIDMGAINTVILGGSNITATQSNSVYVPKLILSTNTDTSVAGTIRWNGTNFQGYNGSSWINLDGAGGGGGTGTVTSITSGNGMNFTNITTSGSITLGTPSSITTSSTNSVTSTSHTHAITGFLALSGGTMTGAITSIKGQIVPFSGLTGTASSYTINAENALNYSMTQNTSFTLNISGLINGMSGIVAFGVLGNINVTLGTMTDSSLNSVTIRKSGTFLGLSTGEHHVITWAYSSKVGGDRNIYINIAEYTNNSIEK